MCTIDRRTLGVTNGTGLHRFNHRIRCLCQTKGKMLWKFVRSCSLSWVACSLSGETRVTRACDVRARMYIGSSLDVFEQLIFNRCGNSSNAAKYNAIDNRLSNERARRRRIYKSRRVKTSDFFRFFFLSFVSSAYHCRLLLYC